MSRHWSFKSVSGPKAGYYTITYENKSANTTAEIKLPEFGAYHNKPKKKMSKTSAEKVGRKLRTLLNKNT